MACTTVRLPTKNRVIADRWTAYCQALHVHRLLHAKPGIELPHEDGKKTKQNTTQYSKRIQLQREKDAKIQQENQILLRKILELEKKSYMSVKAEQERMKKQKRKSKHRDNSQKKHGTFDFQSEISKRDLLRTNRAFIRSVHSKLEKERIARENHRMMQRIISVQSTISKRELEKEERKRVKLLRNLALNSQNRVMGIPFITLEQAKKGKAPVFSNLYPNPPASNKTLNENPQANKRSPHRKLVAPKPPKPTNPDSTTKHRLELEPKPKKLNNHRSYHGLLTIKDEEIAMQTSKSLTTFPGH